MRCDLLKSATILTIGRTSRAACAKQRIRIDERVRQSTKERRVMEDDILATPFHLIG